MPDMPRLNGMRTIKVAYATNGASRSVPMNEVLLATLQACKMTMPVHGPHEPVLRTASPAGRWQQADHQPQVFEIAATGR